MYLADTSAWWVSRRPEASSAKADFDALLLQGQVATCDVVRFELLYSARNGDELSTMAARLDVLPELAIGRSEWKRALAVYRRLAGLGAGRHRSVGYPDLLIAAAAEASGAIVFHYDEDFDRIADLTGQPTRWIAPCGSI